MDERQAGSRWQFRVLASLAAATLVIAIAVGSISTAATSTESKAQPSPRKAPGSFYAVSPQTILGPADFARMGQGKVGTLRIPIFWSEVDQVSPTGDFDFAATDAVVGGAAANGVQVLPFLYGTPPWVAQELDGRTCDPEKCIPMAPKKAAALDAWRAFVAAAVGRYGQNGSFWTDNPGIPKLPIEAWQIWNEQNSKVFFAPKAKPKLYAKLLEAAAGEIGAQDASADVVLGGMPELAGSRKATPGSKYLGKLYDVKGAEKNFDGVGIHPYGARLGSVTEQVDLFKEEIKKAHDQSVDLWVTEIGAGSANGGNPLNRGKQGQAQILTQTYKYFEKQRQKLNVQVVVWFSWMDSTASICDWCATSGLFKAGLVEKPAFRAFAKLTGGS